MIRILGRVLLALALLVGAVGVACLQGVDSRPFLREAYYGDTVRRLNASVATNGVVHGELAAGFGRARLSPTLVASEADPAGGRFRAIPLAGYGNRRGQPATGVRDDVFVKAVALRVADRLGVMVGADALIIPPEVADAAAERLAAELNLGRAQLYLSATHTHCSLGGWGEGPVAEAFAGKFDPGTRVWFADRIVTAVREAVTNLQPAALGQGRFAAPEFIRNRLLGQLGRVDSEFSFLVVRQPAGKLGVLGSFGAHATVLGSDVMQFSGDYPGAWQRAVETSSGGVAVFLAGGVGSHSPVAGGHGFAGADQMGQRLAARLLERLPQTALTNRITFGLVGLDVTLPPLNWRVTDGLRLRPWLAQHLLHARRHTFIQVFRIGDAMWISTPCDFSGELALPIKDFLRARGLNGVITSFNGDYVGYVIPSRYYHLGGYEPRLMSFFGPNLPDYFQELIERMTLGLTNH